MTILAIRYGAVGRLVEALVAIEEVVTIRRRFAEENSSVYEPDLAKSLWTMARLRVGGEPGLLPGALTAVAEAVEIYRRLAAETPAVFAGLLRDVQETQADVLDGLGRTGEAKVIRRRLTDEAPES